MTSTTAQDRRDALVERLFGATLGTLELFGVYLGDRLGLYAALAGADALAVVTDWNEYRHPDFARIKSMLRSPVVVDGRNLYSLERMSALGFSYSSIGRPSAGAR